MANSDEFGQLVTDIVGPLGLREAQALTGLSAAYIGSMRRGHVPSPRKIAQFAAGFEVSPTPLFDAARKSGSGIDPESIIQVACELAGLSTQDRLAVLAEFRKRVNAGVKEQKSKAA